MQLSIMHEHHELWWFKNAGTGRVLQLVKTDFIVLYKKEKMEEG